MSLPETPEHGFKFCNGRGEVGTQCSFVCDHGYKLYGATSVSCDLEGKDADWSFAPPSCRIGKPAVESL